jgi:thiamine-phosphate pyrophosphorylase
MKSARKLGGLYLVVSPILPNERLLSATQSALDGGVDLLQLSASPETESLSSLAKELSGLAKKRGISFLVNNSLELAKEAKADGVHLDAFDVSPDEARRVLGGESIVGYTVNADLGRIEWAEKAGADYVSFCSIFHQCTGTLCPIVSLDTVKNATSASKLAIFGAGGITLENIHSVLEAGVDGVAVTSAILKSKNPEQTAHLFKESLKKYGKKRSASTF